MLCTSPTCIRPITHDANTCGASQEPTVFETVAIMRSRPIDIILIGVPFATLSEVRCPNCRGSAWFCDCTLAAAPAYR